MNDVQDKKILEVPAMCYGMCKYEKYPSGECSNPSKFSKFIDAGCNTNFVCEQCGEECTEEQASNDEATLCIACFLQNEEDDHIDDLALNITIAESDAAEVSFDK
jgi:hypothetical protein